MLLFTKAESNPKYKHFFKINAENSERFGKFDDANFEYRDINGTTKFRVFQIKHKVDEMKLINKIDFINHKDFKLLRYFQSFLEVKKKNGTDDIQHFILLTNLNVGPDCYELLQEIKGNDDILSLSIPEIRSTCRSNVLPLREQTIFKNKIPKRYKLKLHESDEFYDVLKNLCDNDSDLISEFREKFIISSGQPNEKEMDDILKNRLSKLSKLPISDLLGSHFMTIFLDWLKDKCENDPSLSHENMKEIIPFLQIKSENLITTNRYFSKLKQIKYKSNDSTIKVIKNYFNSSSEEYLLIYTEFPKLTMAKIYQCLETETEKNSNSECLIIENNSLQEDICNKLENIKYFKFCVIICENVDDNYILRITPRNNQCKVIILTTNFINSRYAVEDTVLFRELDTVLFRELDPVTKHNILKQFVRFDDNEIPLTEIASIELLDDMKDAKWLHTLTTDCKLIIRKNEQFFDKKLYIERRLVRGTYRLVEKDIIKEYRNVIILSANAGMGKTTLLSSLCLKIKKINPSNWTEIIKITDHIQALSLYNSYNDNDDCIDFLSFKILKHDNFSNQLFKYNLMNVVVMFDAVDEISQENLSIVTSIVKKLLKTDIKQIWLSTRPFVQNYLENQLSVRSWNIEKFSESNQIDVLHSYWMRNGINRTENDIKFFIERIGSDFEISIPLHTKMIAEHYQNDNSYDKFNNFRISEPGRLLLYKKTIKTKYDDYSRNKIGMDLKHEATIKMHETNIITYNEIHGKLAMELLCPTIIPSYNLTYSEIIIINAIGIATISTHGQLNFVHKTYAEYFVAHYIFNQLNDEINDEILDFILFRLTEFVEDKLDEIKKFLNEFLSNSNYSTTFIKRVGERFLNNIKILSIKSDKRLKLSKNHTGQIFEMIYMAIKLLEPNNLKKYRKYFPIILWHKTSFNKITFIERVLEENSEIMQYDLNETFYLEEILQLDSLTVLNKFLTALEQQLDTNQIKEYLTVKYCFVNHLPTCLFYLKVNCCNYFLNYLKQYITPIQDFKQFVLHCNVFYETFSHQCPSEILLWFNRNLDNDFYQLLIRLKNLQSIDDRFIFYYNQVLHSRVFDEITFYQNMLVQVIKNIKTYETLADTILDKLIILRDNCFIESKGDVTIFKGKEEDVQQILKYSRNGSLKFVVKLLKFYVSIYYSKMDDDLYVKLRMISLENDVDYREDLLGWFSFHIMYAAVKDDSYQRTFINFNRIDDDLKRPKLKYRRALEHLYLR